MMKNRKIQNVKIMLSAWLLLVGVASVLIGLKSATDAFIIACLIILLSILCVMKDDLIFEKNISVVSVILSLLFVLQASISQVFELFCFDSMVLGWSFKIIFTLTFLVACFVIINFGLKKIISYKYVPKVEEKKERQLFIFCATLPIVIVTCCFLIYSYPGYEYPDMVACWNWAATKNWNEWHTIGYLLYLRIFYVLFNSSFSVLIAQGVFWILLQKKAIRLVYSVTSNKSAVKLYSLLSCLVFTPMLYCGMLFKDTIYCQCLFALVLCMVEFISTKKPKKWTALLMAVSAIGVSIFRHAGVVAVLLTLLIVVIYAIFLKKKMLKRTFSIIFLIVLVCSTFVNNTLPQKFLKAIPNPQYITYTVPMYQIGAVCRMREDIEQEDIEIIEQIMPLKQWKEISSENLYWADNICREYGTIGGRVLKLNDSKISNQIIKLNVKWFVKYPKEYLTAFFDISSIMWEVGRPSEGYEWAPLEGGAIDSATGNNKIEQTFIRQGLENIADVTLHTPVLRSIFWRGGLWIFVIIFSAVVLLLKKQSKYLITLILPLITVVLLFLSIPAQDPRYILFLIEIGIFMLVMSIFVESKHYEE